MTRPRKELVSLDHTPYYHVFSRCVRRAFLCGEDPYSGQSYEHRRQWVVDRIRLLSSIFAIDVCAYAVMSNHYHIVLKLCPGQVSDLTDDDVIKRWCCLFRGPLIAQRYLAGEALHVAERTTLGDIVSIWRKRITSISWFMKCLNQPIARQANMEDGCTGKFWESRFTSQALKTEEALLSCMAYVDLNPIRANVAMTPEKSDYTSIQERIEPRFDLVEAIRSQFETGDLQAFDIPLKPLLHFVGPLSMSKQPGVPYGYRDYLELVDWTGRLTRHDKPGRIDAALPDILSRIAISPEQWMLNCSQFRAIHGTRFNRVPSEYGSG